MGKIRTIILGTLLLVSLPQLVFAVQKTEIKTVAGVTADTIENKTDHTFTDITSQMRFYFKTWLRSLDGKLSVPKYLLKDEHDAEMLDVTSKSFPYVKGGSAVLPYDFIQKKSIPKDSTKSELRTLIANRQCEQDNLPKPAGNLDSASTSVLKSEPDSTNQTIARSAILQGFFGVDSVTQVIEVPSANLSNDQNQLVTTDIIFDCGNKSQGKRVESKKLSLVNDITAGNQVNKVEAPYSDLQEVIGDAIQILKLCVRNGLKNCSPPSIAHTTKQTLSIICEGCTTLADMMVNIPKDQYSPKLSKEDRDQLDTYHGMYILPIKTLNKMGTLDQGHGITDAGVYAAVAKVGAQSDTQSSSAKADGDAHSVTSGLPIQGAARNMEAYRQNACNMTPISERGKYAMLGDCVVKDPPDSSQSQMIGKAFSNLVYDTDTSPRYFNQEISSSALKNAIAKASAGKVPACILEGITLAEGTSGGGYSDPNNCTINNCSAAGPFQLTTGWAPPYEGFPGTAPNASTPLSSTCSACGNIQCPNALADVGATSHWPQKLSDTNVCNNEPAAVWALELLQKKAGTQGKKMQNIPASQQKDVIIQAANDYFGAPIPIPRFGYLTYGQFVYQHCEESESALPKGPNKPR